MPTYSVKEPALLIAPALAPYIVLAYDRVEGCVPLDAQTAIDDGTFAAKAMANAGLPDYYYDVVVASEGLDTLASERMAGAILDDIGGLCSHGEFSGLATTLEDPSSAEKSCGQAFAFDNSFVTYLTCKKAASLFSSAYGSMNELEREFRARLKGVLPENLNIRPYIVEIEGTYCC